MIELELPLKIVSNVLIEVREEGCLVREISKHNIVTNVGLNLLRDLLGGYSDREPTHVHLGTGVATPAATDTTLGTDVYEAILTRRIQEQYGINFQLYVNENQANGYTLKEAGLFNHRNGEENLFSRVAFDGIVKTSAVTVTISWKITFGRG